MKKKLIKTNKMSLRGKVPSAAEAISKLVDCFVGLRPPRNDIFKGAVISGIFFLLVASPAFAATTVNLASDFVCNSLTVTNNGTLALKGYDMNVGNVTFNAAGAKIDASQAGGPDATQITVTGNWVNTSGTTFTTDNSTVVFAGAGISQIAGSNTFYNFTSTTQNKILHFQADATVTQTILGALTLTGAANNLIVLNHRVGDTGQWRIDPQGTRSVSYVNVSNSNNVSASFVSPSNSTDGGSNTKWFIGTLSAVSVTPASLIAGATGNVTIAFTTSNAILSNGDVQITFPAGFVLPGSPTASSAADISGTLTASVSGQILTVNLGSGLGAGAVVDDLVIPGIKNPGVSGTTGAFAVETQDAGDIKIDEGTGAGVAITAGTLTSTGVVPVSLVAGAVGSVTVSFTTVNPLPADGKILVTFPAGFALDSGAATAAGGLTNLDGTLSASVAGQIITLTRGGGATSSAAGAKSFTLSNVKNPVSTGLTGTFQIKTADATNAAIDQDLSVAAVTITAGSVSYLKITTLASTTLAAGSNLELTVTAYDAGGNVATGYIGDQSLTFSGLANSPNGDVAKVENVSLGTGVSANFSNGVSAANALTLAAYKSVAQGQVAHLNVSDGSNNNSTGDVGYGLDLVILHAAADHLKFSANISSPQEAGTIFSLPALDAVDAYGNKADGANGATAYAGSKTLAYTHTLLQNGPDLGTDAFNPTTVTFASGSSTTTINAALYRAQTGVTITANAADLNGTDLVSNTFDVNARNDNKIKFVITPPASVNANAVWPAFTARIFDNYGNPKTTADIPITLAKVGGGSFGGTPTKNTVAGVATFDNITYATAESINVIATNGSLTSSPQFAVSVNSTTLTGVTATLGNNQADEITNMSVSFTLASALPADGKIKIHIDPDFGVSNIDATDVYSPNLSGSLSASVVTSGSEHVITLTRTGFASAKPGGQLVSLGISDIRTPLAQQTTDIYTIETFDSADSQINSGTTNAGTNIAAPGLAGANVRLDSPIAGASTILHFDFATVTALDNNDKIRIQMDPNFQLTGAVGSIEFGSFDGGISTSVDQVNSRITFTRTSGTQIAAAGFVAIQANITNPGTAGWTQPFTLSTFDADGVTQLSTVNLPGIQISDKNALDNLYVSMESPAADVETKLNLGFMTPQLWPSDGKLEITMARSFNLTNVSSGSAVGKYGSVTGTFVTTKSDGAANDVAAIDVITLTRSNGLDIPAGSFIAIGINHVKNPSSEGKTSDFTVKLKNAANADISTGTAPGVYISTSILSAGSVTLGSSQMGQTTNAQISFSVGTLTLPGNGKIRIMFDWDFNLTGATTASVMGGTLDGTLTATPTDNMVELTRVGGTDKTNSTNSGTVTVQINGVQNPSVAKMTSPYFISIHNNDATLTLISSVTANGTAIGVAGVQWTAAGPDSKWSTATNWSGNVKPTAADDVVINGCPNGKCPVVDENTLVKSIHLGQSAMSTLFVEANLSASNEIVVYSAPTWNPYGGTDFNNYHNFGAGSRIVVRSDVTDASTALIAVDDVNINTGRAPGNISTYTAVNGGSASKPRGKGFTISAPTIKLFESAAIDASGQGYQAKDVNGIADYYGGPGYPSYSFTGVDRYPGASHAGAGGFAGQAFPPSTYMNTNPTELGSAGLSFFGAENKLGGPGGGALKIICKDLILYNSSVQANGFGGKNTSGTMPNESGAGMVGGGGGSGGSVWITTSGTDSKGNAINYGTGTISGNFGMIFANGGEGFGDLTCGAGGGFIKIENMTLDPSAEVFVEAKGGSGFFPGSPGIVIMPKRALILEGGTMRDTLELRGRSDAYEFSSVTIKNGGKLIITGDPFTGTNGLGVTVKVDTTFTVEAGGEVLSGMGFPPQMGPGFFSNFQGTYDQGGFCNTCDSNYMGNPIVGGATTLYTGSSMFGTGAPSINESSWAWVPPPPPPDPSSYITAGYLGLAPGGPSAGNVKGGDGGASIKIEAPTVTIDGSIKMDGEESLGDLAGGGAGGSITITPLTAGGACTLGGTGNIWARGGDGNDYKSPAGGGGFIHLKDVTNFNFQGSVNSGGGAGTNGGANGAPGIVVLPDNLALTVKSGKTWALGEGTYNLASLTIEAGGELKTGIDQSSSYGDGVIFNVTGNVTIDGLLNGKGAGFSPSGGPSESRAPFGSQFVQGVNFTAGPGGCHGGFGGRTANGETTATTFDTAMQPTGSGGGGGYFYEGGAGGGAVKIKTTGTLTVGPTGSIDYRGSDASDHITSDGAPAKLNGGGGAGGSIWLDVGTLAGSGTILAGGGSGTETGNGGGGGGGRVALWYNTKNWTGVGANALNVANVVPGNSSYDSGDPGTLAENTAPTATSLGPSGLVTGVYTSDNTPTFTLTLSDSDTPAQTVRFSIEINTAADFGAGTEVVDYESALQTQGSATFTVGQAAGSGTYQTGSAGQTLSDSTAGYYWRVVAKDEYGKTSTSATTANSGAVAFKLNTAAATATLTNSSGTEQSSYTIGTDSLYATVSDIDQNNNSSSQETVSVTITDNVSGDSESVTLTETGNNTATFRNSSGLTTALYDGSVTANDSTFETTGSSTITVTYSDGGTDRTDTATTSMASSVATILLTNTSSGTSAESTFTIASESVYVRLTDSDKNTNGATVQSISVTVSGSASGINDSVSLSLTETGANTGIFVNSSSLTTALGAASDSPSTTLYVKDAETITATYSDNAADRTTTATMAVAVSDATIIFTNSDGTSTISSYQIATDSIYVKVTDTDRNTNGSTSESFTVTLTNATTSDSVSVTLTETGANTGLFKNSTGISSAQAAAITSDSILQTGSGEIVTATYTDSSNTSGSSTSRTTTATMSTASAGETVELVNSGGSGVTSYLIGTDSVYIKITDSDENESATAENTITVTLSNPTSGYTVAGTGDTMTLTLVETGINTGIFQYEVSDTLTGVSLALNDAVTSDTILQVIAGSTIRLSYTDNDTNATTSDTATASVASSASTTAITDSSANDASTVEIGGANLFIKVTDSDENSNGNSAQTITVTVTDSKTEDSESVTLAETGNNTGIFRNTVGLSLALVNGAASNNNGTLETQDGATVTATYTDDDDSSDKTTDTATTAVASTVSATSFTNSSGSDVTSYVSTADLVFVTTTDVDENTNGSAQETITVTIASSVANDRESITLKETQNNSGIFRNLSGLSTVVAAKGTSNDGKIQVSSQGDTLTATYLDNDDAGDSTKDTATVGSVSFVVTPNALSQMAGTAFTVKIEARNGSEGQGGTLTTYAGKVELTVNYVDPVVGSDKLTPATTSDFVDGIATVTVAYPNTGVITIQAADDLDSSMMGTSGQVTFYPTSFSVSAEGSQLTVNKNFSLTIKALNAQGTVTSNYNGTVNVTHKNISPDSKSGSLTPGSVKGADFANGVAVISNAKFDKWGTITITATDNTYASATGISENVSFLPKSLVLDLETPSASRSFYYINEPLDITVKAVDALENVIGNYGGTVEFSGLAGASVSPASYTFNPAADGGAHLFTAIASNEGKFILKAQDKASSSISGSSKEFEVKYARIVVDDARAPVGSTLVNIRVVDSFGNLITEEDSMTVSLALFEGKPNDSANTEAVSASLRLSNGQAQALVTDTEPEVVSVAPSSSPEIEGKSGEVNFGAIGEGVHIDYWHSEE